MEQPSGESQHKHCASPADFIFTEEILELHDPGALNDVPELSFDTEALTEPVAGCPVGVYECRGHIWSTAEIQIVFQSPFVKGCGVAVMSMERREHAEEAVRCSWDKLETSDKSAVTSPAAYQALRAQAIAVSAIEQSPYGLAALLKHVAQSSRNCNHLSVSTEEEAESVAQEIGRMAMELRLEECDSCPICLEAIAAEDAVMRCHGATGGHHRLHHYFHADCLRQWKLGQ